MNQQRAQPQWSTHGRCISVYEWGDAPQQIFQRGNQAQGIKLMKRKKRKNGSTWEPGVYICKVYGVGRLDQSEINEPKYIFREWETLSSIRHDNIVAYEDFAYDPGRMRLAQLWMEYCRGGDLREFVYSDAGSDKRLSCEHGAQVLHQLGQALLYIHHGIYKFGAQIELARLASDDSKGGAIEPCPPWTTILHRDIKPGNVFIVERTKDIIMVKLGDFGIAKFETDGTDTYVGSRDYFAPEQRNASFPTRRTTFKSDIYALGVTVRQTVNTKSSWSSSLISDLSACLENVLGGCLERSDETRISSLNIVDTLRPHIENQDKSMLYETVEKTISWPTDGTSSRKKKLRTDLSRNVNLCRRLLLAGSDPNAVPGDKPNALDSVKSCIERQFECLANDVALGSFRCPAWKVRALYDLASLLTEHGSMGLTCKYNIGKETYATLESASAAQRKVVLRELLETRGLKSNPSNSRKRIDDHLSQMDYMDLFALTAKGGGVHENAFASLTRSLDQHDAALTSGDTIETQRLDDESPHSETRLSKGKVDALFAPDRSTSHSDRYRELPELRGATPTFFNEGFSSTGTPLQIKPTNSLKSIADSPSLTEPIIFTPDSELLTWSRSLSPFDSESEDLEKFQLPRPEAFTDHNSVQKAVTREVPALREETEEERIEREIAEIEAREDEREKAYQKKKKEEREAAALKRAKAAANADKELKRQEREAEELEEQKERERESEIAEIEAKEEEEEEREKVYRENKKKELEAAATVTAEAAINAEKTLKRQEREAEEYEEEQERQREAGPDEQARLMFASLKKPALDPDASDQLY